MNPKKLIVLFSLISSLLAQGQPTVDTTSNILFENGIYLENLGITIPWNFEISDTAKYGHPKVKRLTGRTLSVRWDSVRILNGISASIYYHPARIFLGGGEYTKMWYLYAFFDEKDFVNLKKVFDQYSPVNKTIETENFASYTFTNVRLRLWRNDKRHGNLLQVQLIK